ncbi:tape measure protein [Rhodobacteraceae bacterium IMCC1335]
MQAHDTILTEYRADTRNFKRGANVYDRTLARQERLTNDRLGRVDKRWDRSTRSILQSRTALVGLTSVVGGAAINQLRNYAEQWRDVERRLQSIGAASSEAQQSIIDLAIRTRSAVGSTAEAVQGMARATDSSFESAARRVETLQKLLKVGGAGSSEADSVSTQLGQALKSGVLAGDEYKSLSENAPTELLDAIAKAAGATRSELKAFAADGKLTADVVLVALDNLASTADAKFGALALSGSEAFSVLTTGLIAYVGNVDEGLGATETFNGAIASLGEYAAGAGESAQTMAQAIKVVGSVALATAGSRGVGALSGAFRKAAQERRDDVVAAKAQHAVSRQTVLDTRKELAAIREKQRVRGADHQLRLLEGRASVASGKKLQASIDAEAKAIARLQGAHARAVVTTAGLTAAQARLSIATRLTTGAVRAFNGVMAFFGGPIGLAITAITLVVAVMANMKTGTERLQNSLDGLSNTLGKLEGVNTSLASDYGVLKDAQEQLAEATRKGGDASVEAATKDVAAVNERIRANERLRQDLAILAQAELNAAQRELEAQQNQLQRDARTSLLESFHERTGSFKSSAEWEEYRQIQSATTEELSRHIEVEKELARQLIQSGATMGDLTDFQRELLESTTESEAKVEELSQRLELLNTAGKTAAIGLDQAIASARQLAADAAAAQAGVAGLIAAIPALNRAARAQQGITKANLDYQAALKGLNGQGLSGLERIEAERELANLRSQAISEISGEAAAIRLADKAQSDYLDSARLGAMDARNQALSRETAQYLEVAAAMTTAGRSQEDLAKAEAAYQQRVGQINSSFDKRDTESGGGTGGARAAERAAEKDLAAARGLLVENGHKALFIEQELNRERERLRGLLPELISLGLSRADAESVLGAELERTEDRLKRVKTAGEQAAKAFAKNVLQDIRAADDLNDALGRISERLLDLAFDKSFDLLAEQFARLGTGSSQSGGGGIGGFLGNIFGSLFGGGVKAATGGLIRGPGTATSDSIPARLSNGEFVMRASSVTPQSLPFLEAINRGAVVPKFATGGLVGGGGSSSPAVGSLMKVEIHNHASNARVEARPSSDGRGLEVMVHDLVNGGIIGGKYTKSMGQKFGLRPTAKGT